ncbi:MAG: stage III sporulation protein AB [Bacillota bacterium]|nr:stage III sporulation protein AB [Bacillota bacterium]
MNTYREAASLLPINLCGELLVMPERIQANAEELRVRAGRPVAVLSEGREYEVAPNYKICCDDLYSILEKATFASFHSVENELAKGFITVGGGIRIGICGTAIYKSGKLSSIKNFSSMAIRIPHDIIGCSSEICEKINSHELKSALIISPPGYGKTTFARDYIRNLSKKGFRVSVADERCELCAVMDGVPQYDIGPCTDVMNGVSKSDAVMMMLRSMTPHIIAMDEISEPEDVRAVSAASGCGIKLLATAHAAEIDDLRRRPVYRELLNMNIFDCAVIISKAENNCRLFRIEDLLK